MNLVMLLPWIQVSFKFCDGTRITYTEKTLCVYGRTDVRDIGASQEKNISLDNP